MVDKEKQSSFLLHQDIEPPSRINIYPCLFHLYQQIPRHRCIQLNENYHLGSIRRDSSYHVGNEGDSLLPSNEKFRDCFSIDSPYTSSTSSLSSFAGADNDTCSSRISTEPTFCR